MAGFLIPAALVIFIAVIAVRTIRFTPKPQPAANPEEITFDKEASIDALAQLIRCKTISYNDKSLEDNAEFEKLIALLPELYPHVFEVCSFDQLPDRYAMEDHMPVIEKILNEMADRKVHLEINPALAFALQDHSLFYPQQEIMEMAIRRGVRFTYGSDAHRPEHVGRMLDELRSHPVYGGPIAVWEAEGL